MGAPDNAGRRCPVHLASVGQEPSATTEGGELQSRRSPTEDERERR